ncbi:hypothetical protein HS041_02750 [Planomonospora sp. ID67723]|uniref:DUF6157 family protein n=1 Tax=Planomonospora sp. ID67723 TaxID=2738134 RepID=UPI0018C352FF|nr:DUF6157 family protein [Planomonospora sp. ID67723]MBG0826693.1 hypothetical protein [Planomonospora sp. ID67723]
MDLNYYRTLIVVAEDCPVSASVVPPERGDKPTVASLQHRMIAEAPGTLTQEDVLFHTWLRRQEPAERSANEVARLRDAFFSKPQACLRASPLPKKFGWGLLFDAEGRISLCPMESDAYRRIAAGDEDGVTVLKAMRSRRA